MKLIKPINFVIIIFILFCSSSCLKKGVDDPSISFKTRKARLVGNWHLTGGKEEYRDINNDIGHESTTTLIYIGNTYHQIDVSNGYKNSSSGSFSFTMEFKGDGGFSSTKGDDKPHNSFVSKGSWNFTKGIGKHKNKEQIVINQTSTAPLDPLYQSILGRTFSGNRSDFTYTIKELREKKLVLVTEYNIYSDEDNGTYAKSELTFEQ